MNVGRVYTYSQDGDMLAALVNGLLTTFDYDGDGHRLRLSVAGEVTTYTLDYAGGFRVLLEEGGAFANTKHYLYGLACIGEQVDAGEVDGEWRFYQRDGSSLVRQTTNIQATVTLAWTYSPEGAVLLGEEGPVTNLDCSGNTIYDFSTGLIFKNGKYFDPNTGIWTTMGGLVVYHAGWQPYNRKRKWGKGKKRLVLLLLLLFLALILAGCGGSDPIDDLVTPATAAPEIVVCPEAATPVPTNAPVVTQPPPQVGTQGPPQATETLTNVPTFTPSSTPTNQLPSPTLPPPTPTTQPLPTPPYNDTNLYNYQIRQVGAGDNLLYYIEVNYSEGSWAFYTTQSGHEAGTVRIPVRSTDLEWGGTYAETYSGLETWEIGARNIVAEMSAAIQNRKEYATADAIAIAYSPYNRSNSIGTGWSGKDVIDLLLGEGASGQYAGSSFPVDEKGNPLPYNYLAVEPVRFRGADTFEFALIVAYGVDQGYLWDPSFGSMNYAHRTPPDGPLYVRNPGSPQTTFGMMRERGIIP